MINYIKGDLLSSKENYIVHGCNAQGVMKSGVAKAIREKYPRVYDDYSYAYSLKVTNTLCLGQVIQTYLEDEDQYIISAITQKYYGRDPNIRYVSYDAVDRCMINIKEIVPINKTIAMPKIGAGLGNGNWNVIEAIINDRLSSYSVFVYEID